MGFIHISVGLKALDRPNDPYEADFLVYTGATDTLAPPTRLGTLHPCPYHRSRGQP